MIVEIVPVKADFSPWPMEAVGLYVVWSFPVFCYPGGQAEKCSLEVRSSMKRESVVDQMKPHRDWQTRAAVKA